MEDLEHVLSSFGVNMLLVATAILFVLSFISLKIKKPKEAVKKILFISIVITTIVPTLYLAGSTVYLNTISSSGGPVHWHADIEIWACGKEADLIDPTGWSNKVGTATLHEHNDKRIHLEGVVVKPNDASLGKFFNVIGGEISDVSLSVPTTEGQLSLNSGDMCPQGPGELQVFVYKTDKDNYYSQTKLSNPEDYIISPYSQVPTGDCIIVEYDAPKDRTDKLCRSYKVAEQIEKLKGEKNGN